MPKKFPVFTMSGYKLSNFFADVIISNDQWLAILKDYIAQNEKAMENFETLQ